MGAGRDERAAFEQAFESCHELVLRYCYRRTGDIECARELTQETFVVAWRRRRDAPDQMAPWLYGIARRVLADYWRAQRARPVTVPLANTVEVGEPDAAIESIGLVEALRSAFQRLSEADREVLRLVTWEGLGLKGAALVLGCSRPAAAVRLFRARQRLARLLETPAPATSATAKSLVDGRA